MKKESRSLKLRIFSAVVSFLLAVSMLPIHTFAETAAAQSAYDKIMANNSAPDAFGNNDLSPYGTKKGEAFMLAPQNEMMLVRTYGDIQRYSWHKGYAFGENVYTDTNISAGRLSYIDLVYDSNAVAGICGPFKERGFIDYHESLRFMQAIAFDPTGSGRDDHVAFIGYSVYAFNPYNDIAGAIQVYVMNTNTGKVSEMTHAGYSRIDPFMILDESDASNFFGITAGHYDKNRTGETLVTYSALHDSNYCIKEWTVTYESGSSTPVLNVIKSDKTYLHKSYKDSGGAGATMGKSKDMGERLACNLASGDVNGDGIDDLAVLSYVMDPRNNGDNQYHTGLAPTFYSPELVVVLGSTGSILGKSSQFRHWVRASDGEVKVDDVNCKVYRSVVAPSVDIGDVNGDGRDEVVTAGWALDIYERKDNSTKTQKREMVDGVTTYVYGYSDDGKNLPRLSWDRFTDFESNKVINKWSKAVKTWRDGAFNDNDRSTTVPQFIVKCVALNGGNAAEYIFMNGTLNTYGYDSNVQKNTIIHKYTPEYFKHTDDPCHDMGVAFGFIASAAVGVFDDNEVGREQIAVSVGLKDDGKDNHADDYSYMLGMIGGRNYADKYEGGKIVSYGNLQYYYSTAFDRDERDFATKGSYMPYNTGALDSYLNCLVVAIDRGQDGTVARYAGKKFVYADPKAVGVLQAAPYFGEFEYYGGSTSYTVTVENEFGKSRTDSLSYSVGMSVEVEGPGVRVAVGAGYSGGFSETFEETFGQSYSDSFSVTSKNGVIMQRTPLIIYQYDVALDSDHGGSLGKWKTKDSKGLYPMEITVPCEPVFTTLTVEEYNSFVTEYNKKHGESFNIITNPKLTENEGHPERYADAWTSGMTRLSLSAYEVSTATGDISSTYTSSYGSSTSSETTNGYYVNASIGAGASFPLGSVYAGVDTSVEGSTSYGSSKSTSKHQEASGTVQHLGDIENVPMNILSQYGFSWTFGTWTMWLNKEGPSPVYGYVVDKSTLRKAQSAPTGLNAVDGAEKGNVNITWNAVTGASGYNIYIVNDLGEYVKVNTSPLTENKYTYTIDENNHAPSVIFAVTSLSGGTSASSESTFSEKFFYYRQSFGLSAYELAVKAGFNGTEAEWLESLKGKDGNGIKDVDIDENGRLLVTLDDGRVLDLGSIMGAAGIDGENGSDGQNGADGAPGRGIKELKINEKGELVVTYTDETTQNLGSVGTWAGKDGREVNMRVDSGYIQWQLTGDTEWKNLISLDELKVTGGTGGTVGVPGTPGKDGREIELRVDGGYLQWHYVDESEWTNLISIASLGGGTGGTGATGPMGPTGPIGPMGPQGPAGKGIASIGMIGSSGLVDIYLITYTDSTTTSFTVTNGTNGIDGIDGEPGEDGHTPIITIEDGFWYIDGVSTGQSAEGIRGETGNGISDISLTASVGNLDIYTITFTDGETFEFTVTNGVDGVDGADGADGVGVKSVEINESGELVITLTNGDVSNLGRIIGADGRDGADGVDGVDGINGKDGIGIKNIEISANGELIITLTDSSINNLGVIVGRDGKDGVDGVDGKDGTDGREIELRVADGYIQWHYVGETEWKNLVSLDTLKGEKGDTGATGAAGPQGEKGDKGDTGATGAQGEKGEKGDTGATGAQGPKGDKGDTGAAGADGKDGVDGIDGLNGANGVNGSDGADGEDGQITTVYIMMGVTALLGNIGWGAFLFSKFKK